MLRLVEINSKVKLDKMSTKDSQEFQDAMQAGQKGERSYGLTIRPVVPQNFIRAHGNAGDRPGRANAVDFAICLGPRIIAVHSPAKECRSGGTTRRQYAPL